MNAFTVSGVAKKRLGERIKIDKCRFRVEEGTSLL